MVDDAVKIGKRSLRQTNHLEFALAFGNAGRRAMIVSNHFGKAAKLLARRQHGQLLALVQRDFFSVNDRHDNPHLATQDLVRLETDVALRKDNLSRCKMANAPDAVGRRRGGGAAA